jgi:hypothetical protein
MEQDRRLQALGARIEELLDEVEAVAGPNAWPRVESLVTALVDLYGAGFARMLELSRAEARDSSALDARIAADEIVGSLLLLHGLHPVGVQERVEKALAQVGTEAGRGGVELVKVEEGVVHLRVDPMAADDAARRSFAHVAARAIHDEVPDVMRVDVEGLPTPPAPDLVGLDRLRAGGRR